MSLENFKTPGGHWEGQSHSLVRGIKRVKQGHFREGGNGLYDFKKSNGYISFVGVYSAVILATILCKVVNNYGNILYKVFYKILKKLDKLLY